MKLFPSPVNREKGTIEAIVVIAFTIITFPVCFCLVSMADLILLVVPTTLKRCVNESAIKRAFAVAVCFGVLYCTSEKRAPRFIHYVAVEILAIMNSNANRTRKIYSTICYWSYYASRCFGRKKSEGDQNQLISVHIPRLPDNKPRGLVNLGNTCYFNSVMQPLCNTHAFSRELQNTNQNEKLTLSFLSMTTAMETKGTEAFAPSEVRYDFVKNVSRFDNRGQHDSHECLRHFLDEIRKEQRKTLAGSSGSKGSLTTVDTIFGGHLATVYICKECDKHYHLFEPCLDISLPVFFETEVEHEESKEELIAIDNNKDMSSIGEQNSVNYDDSKSSETAESVNQSEKRHKGSKAHKCDDDKENIYKCSVRKLTNLLGFQSTGDLATDCMTGKEFIVSPYSKTAITLYDCFRHFSRLEQIKEEYLCEDCLREAMARGEADEDNLKLTSATKQTLIFNPPAILTIHFKRFELLPGRSKKRSDMVDYPVYLDIAPYCSSQCLRNDPPRNNIWYSLYAVVVHSGSLEFGHYVAYVKEREGKKNIRGLSRFLQHEYFNHNITSDELIQMMNKKDQENNRDSNQPEREEDSTLYLWNDSSDSERVPMFNTEEQEKSEYSKQPEIKEEDSTWHLMNYSSDSELVPMMNKEDQEKSVDGKQPEREEEASKWYLMNDSWVREVSVDEVLRQEAYLLFYERVGLTE